MTILAGFGLSKERVHLPRQTLTLAGVQTALQQFGAETTFGQRAVVYLSARGTQRLVDGRCQQAVVTQDGRLLSASDFDALLDPIRARGAELVLLVDASFRSAPSGAFAPDANRRAKFADSPVDVTCAPADVRFAMKGRQPGTRSTLNLDREDIVVLSAKDDEPAFEDAATGGVASRAWRECSEPSRGADSARGDAWAACVQQRLDSGTSRQHMVLLGSTDRLLALQQDLQPPAGRRVALVIGNGSYARAPLANPTNDARDFAAQLKALGFDVISQQNVTARDFGGLLAQFRSRLAGASVGLFFYAGHGMQVRGENYLPGVDEQIRTEEDVPSQSLPVRQVVEVLEGAKVPLGLLFLDACRNNPFARSTRSGSQGLSRFEAAAGMLISFATRPGSVASDGDGGRNGMYTGELLTAIRTAGDQPVELMLKRVASGVRAASRGQQDPWIEGSLTGDFCFAGCSGALAAGGQKAVTEPSATPTVAIAVSPQSGRRPEAAGTLPAGSVARPAAPSLAGAKPLAPPPESKLRALAMSSAIAYDMLFVHGDTPSATGRIYRVSDGRVEERFGRSPEGNRGIHAAATTAGGEIYFCDGTEARILRLRNGRSDTVYRHDGFVRHLAFDNRGRLHFSSTPGPRGDGAVYRLEGDKPVLVAQVKPDAVGGSWSGTFAFDGQGTLWLSSGDATPSGLYRWDQGQPKREFQTLEHAIMGFAFAPDGSVVFADNQHSVFSLRLPGAPVKLFESPYGGRLRDVSIAARRSS